MTDYEAKWRDALYPLFKPVCVWNLIQMILRYVSNEKNRTQLFFLYGTMTLSFFLLTAAVELNLKAMDYMHFWVILVRIVAAFTLIHLVSIGT